MTSLNLYDLLNGPNRASTYELGRGGDSIQSITGSREENIDFGNYKNGDPVPHCLA